jgi:hypothetical protein
MKILMFGWEFLPQISGVLGTTCHGLTQTLNGAKKNCPNENRNYQLKKGSKKTKNLYESIYTGHVT